MALALNQIRRQLLAIISGIFFWAGFAPIENGVFPIFGGAILFYLLADRAFSERLISALLCGLAFFLPLLHWSSTYVGAAPWLILAAGEGLLFALVALFPLRKNLNGVLCFAAVFLLVELIRMKLPFGGFGWGRIGFTQVETLNSLYPFLGVSGIAFAVSVISALIVLRRIPVLLGVFAFLLVVQFISVEDTGDDALKIAAVQGGVTQLGLDFNSRALEVLQRHIVATSASGDIDLVLWPENSVDVDPIYNAIAREKLTDFISEVDTFVLTGTVEKSANGPKNSSVLYRPDGTVLSRYVKQDLAPFGEYIPLRSIAEKVSVHAKNVNDFVPGSSWQPMIIDGQRFQSFICFEVLDDDHVRAGAKDMDFLIAQTNNATFGDSPQAAQQLQITRARAAELGKEFAVVSTTGFTSHLNAQGEIVASLEQFTPGTLKMEISSRQENTLASGLGTGFWAVFGGLILIAGAIVNRR